MLLPMSALFRPLSLKFGSLVRLGAITMPLSQRLFAEGKPTVLEPRLLFPQKTKLVVRVSAKLELDESNVQKVASTVSGCWNFA